MRVGCETDWRRAGPQIADPKYSTALALRDNLGQTIYTQLIILWQLGIAVLYIKTERAQILIQNAKMYIGYEKKVALKYLNLRFGLTLGLHC
jgi:hypothetical protein